MNYSSEAWTGRKPGNSIWRHWTIDLCPILLVMAGRSIWSDRWSIWVGLAQNAKAEPGEIAWHWHREWRWGRGTDSLLDSRNARLRKVDWRQIDA